ncbi:MAG: extracellular solute-binding protein [Clostridiales bacterium]|nr:extracellular solute-binding protein [Clostridiales bacterium]
MKKLISLTLALLMVFSMAACGTTNTAPPPGNASSSGAGAIMDPRSPYPETVTVTACRVLETNPHFLEGDDMESNPMSRWMNEKLNINYKVVWQVETTEYANKLSLSIAAGDIPDLIPMRTSEYLIFRSLVENGLVADLGEAFEKCAGEYMLDTFASYDNRNLEPFTIDGTLYAIGGGQYAYEHELVWMRKDWLEACGLSLPKTAEDIANIVRTFQEKKPGGTEVGGIPISSSDNAQVGLYNSSFEFSSVLYSTGGAPKAWVRDENGEVVYGSILPGMKEGLAILADWYKEGIIDKQFITRPKSGAVEAMVAGGEVGVWFAPWWNGYQINELITNFPEAEVICTSAPVTSDGKYRHSWPALAGDFIAVNSGFQYPELVVKMLNLEYDMHRGFDEEAFAIWTPSLENNISWTAAFPTGGLNLEYMDAVPRSGKIAKSVVETGVLAEGLEGTADMMRWAESAKSYADTRVVDGSNWLDYVCRYIGASEVQNPISEPVVPVFSYATDSMATLKPNLDKLENEMYLQIVLGEKPVEYFDEFVTQWKAQGGDKLTEEVRALVGD